MAAPFDWDAFEEQPGDADPTPFSFRTKKIVQPQISCHIAFTTPETLRIIRENVHRSAMYSGQIEGIGPRYCPSIEDKIVKFPDKTQHQFFLEPEGPEYARGLRQWHVHLTAHGSAVADRALHSRSGECRDAAPRIRHRIRRGRRHRTRSQPSREKHGRPLPRWPDQRDLGYEEAACQGIMAGINAALWLKGEPPFTMDRTEGYTGILIDDLISKGTNEPYRMFTSRAEFRLHLRIDNADRRLTPYGRRLGLINDEARDEYEQKQARMVALEKLLATRKVDVQT